MDIEQILQGLREKVWISRGERIPFCELGESWLLRIDRILSQWKLQKTECPKDLMKARLIIGALKKKIHANAPPKKRIHTIITHPIETRLPAGTASKRDQMSWRRRPRR